MADTPRKVRTATDEELKMLTIYEQAYVGYEDEKTTPTDSPHHPAQVLSQAEINDPGWRRLWKPRNFLGKVVEEPVGYLGHLRPRLNVTRTTDEGSIELDPDKAEDKALLEQLYTFYERTIRPRQADLVLWQGMYGRSFAKLAYDPGTWLQRDADGKLDIYESGEEGLHLVPYPRFEGGIERAEAWHDSEDPDRITSAVVYWLERDPDPQKWDNPDAEQKYAQLLYPDRIEWLKLTGSGWVLDENHGVGGIEEHSWGVVPMVECWNNGKPDVHDGLETQAILNKDVYDQNAHAQLLAFPQRYRKGLIPPGGWKRNPLTGALETVEPMKGGPFTVWDVPTDGEVGQLEADNGEALQRKYESDLADLATLCRSVAVFKTKGAGMNTSGESKHMDSTQVLEPRLENKAEGLAACVRDIYRVVFAMAEGDPKVKELLGIEDTDGIDIECVFDLDLDRDVLAEAQIDQADRQAGNISLHTYLIRRGFTEGEAKKEADRLKAEREQRMEEQAEAQKMMDPYGTGAKPKPPGSNGSSSGSSAANRTEPDAVSG